MFSPPPFSDRNKLNGQSAEAVNYTKPMCICACDMGQGQNKAILQMKTFWNKLYLLNFELRK